MDTLKAYDILRDEGGFNDREARGVVRAHQTALESVHNGRDPDTLALADMLSEAGFDGDKPRAIARAIRKMALLRAAEAGGAA